MLFVQVVQAGSFTKAASVLFSSKSNISRRISQLEQQLDATLLQRTARGLSLTQQGQTFYQECLLLKQQFEKAKDNLQQQQVSISGHIAITAPMSLGGIFLGPLVSKFLSHYPEMGIELALSDHAIPLLESHYDIAIRAVKTLADSSLHAKLLHSYDYVIAASPDYFEKYGKPVMPEALSNHRTITCITSHKAKLKSHWPFVINQKAIEVKINSVAQVTHMWVQKKLALDAIGIIRVPRYWVKDELDQGLLVSIFDEYLTEHSNIYALYKNSDKNSRRIKVFIEYLAKHLPQLLMVT